LRSWCLFNQFSILSWDLKHKVSDNTKQKKISASSEEDTAETTANTNKWARTKDVEIGEIEAVQTNVSSDSRYLSVNDANSMLHAVV
jgi:hypothetical protein